MKKVTALILVLVMICPLVFAACTDSQSGPPAGNNEGNGTDATTTAATTTASQVTTDDGKYIPDPEALYSGMVGIGTNGASVEVDSLVVTNTQNNSDMVSIDFSSDAQLADWVYATAVGGNWGGDKADFAITKGENNKKKEIDVLAFTDTSATGSMAYFGDSAWNCNVKFVAQLKIVEVGNGVSVYFCVHDANNYIELVVGADNGEYLVVNHVVNGESTEVDRQPLFLSDLDLENPVFFPVTIRYEKEYINAYVNGKKIFEVFGEPSAITGTVGLGSWATMNSFDNLVITSNEDGSVLYEDDFSSDDAINNFAPKQYSGGSANSAVTEEWLSNWTIVSDDADHGNVLKNNVTYEGNVVVLKDGYEWSNYTIDVDARIDTANEGWLMYFGVVDDDNYVMWNIGGWGNTKTCFEPTSGGTKTTLEQTATNFSVGEWHHITIVVYEKYALAYVDGELLSMYSAL